MRYELYVNDELVDTSDEAVAIWMAAILWDAVVATHESIQLLPNARIMLIEEE